MGAPRCRKDAVGAVRAASRISGAEAEPGSSDAACRRRSSRTGRQRSSADVPVPETVERDALGGLLEVREAAALLDEGRSLAQATQALRTRHFAGRDLDHIGPPVMISAAIDAATRLAVSVRHGPEDLGNRKADARLAWGHAARALHRAEDGARIPDVGAASAEEARAVARQQPVQADRLEPNKHQVIAEADERDRLLRDEVAARDNLDLRQKRAHLTKVLEPRLTDDALEKHHARLTAIIGAAGSKLGWHGPGFTSVLPAYRKEAARRDNRAEDPLDLRVTKAKKRSIWSAARMTTLLTSPIYTGCSTVKRRWQPGTRIIRDALYWLPLIQFTMGPRPEEAACGSAWNVGSDPLSVHVGWDHAAPRSRARRGSSLARPYIWRLTS
jgi:hypothetical protein